MTVTGVIVPSGSNNWVIPSFLPIIPLTIITVLSTEFRVLSGES
jgi:hypothetical protein